MARSSRHIKNLACTLAAHLQCVTRKREIEIWFQDEAWVGQKNGIVRQWACKGKRPSQPADQCYENAYLFGAICPARGADTDVKQLHINEIALQVAKSAHALRLLDHAAWHVTGTLK